MILPSRNWLAQLIFLKLQMESKLGDLLRLIDTRIMEAGKNKGIETNL